MATIGQGIGPAMKEEAIQGTVDWKTSFAPSLHQSHILVVDDDWGVRETLMLLLGAAGYQITGAQNGFEALQQLKKNVPALLLCDLEMPSMSGFELLSIVRRRFPEIAVIAMSGSYRGGAVPENVMADAFYGKGQQTPPELFRIVAEVLRASGSHAQLRQAEPAPIWGRWIGTDTSGTSYVLLNCPDCLRSFPVTANVKEARTVQEAYCIFCSSEIRYMADRSTGDQSLADAVFSILTQHQGAQHQ